MCVLVPNWPMPKLIVALFFVLCANKLNCFSPSRLNRQQLLWQARLVASLLPDRPPNILWV